MASPGTSIITQWSELASSTYRRHSTTPTDNVSRQNALWRRIGDKGNARLETGGLTLVEPLDYQANSTLTLH